MISELALIFQGPFSLVGDNAIIAHSFGKESGIYLWTVETPKGFETLYVGKTNVSFSNRTAQHLKDQFSGKDGFCDANALRKGKKDPIWRGTVGNPDVNILDFRHNLQKYSPLLQDFIRTVKFFGAPLRVESDRMLLRVEGAIINHLQSLEGKFIDGTLHSKRWKTEPGIPARVECPAQLKLVGFPAEIIV